MGKGSKSTKSTTTTQSVTDQSIEDNRVVVSDDGIGVGKVGDITGGISKTDIVYYVDQFPDSVARAFSGLIELSESAGGVALGAVEQSIKGTERTTAEFMRGITESQRIAAAGTKDITAKFIGGISESARITAAGTQSLTDKFLAGLKDLSMRSQLGTEQYVAGLQNLAKSTTEGIAGTKDITEQFLSALKDVTVRTTEGTQSLTDKFMRGLSGVQVGLTETQAGIATGTQAITKLVPYALIAMIGIVVIIIFGGKIKKR